ncbi:hypothetical protein [Stenotrophomonas sp. Iso1]|uniref:hypothetical protein n=1 Tax=Stenotrophomonas sp. Iso1 TaxID=2977283 RepID=UPI0022B78A9F|nr:hypothetical protein [Stenotrophomonas sp. Iso1]
MFSALIGKLFKDKPDPDRFAQKFMEAVRAKGYPHALEYDADTFRIRHANGSYFNLHNAYQAYLGAPRAQQRKALESFSQLLGIHDNDEAMTLEQARPLLRPLIRSITQLEEINLHHAEQVGWSAPPQQLQYRRLSEECVELLAVDHPDHTATLTRGPLEEWGISFDQALAIARANLRQSPDEPFVEVAPGVYQAAWGDAYDSSRVLLPDLLHRVPVAGLPVFMLATRDMLLVTGERDLQAQAHMLEMAGEAFADGRVISWEVLRYDEGQLHAHVLADAALREKQRQLRLELDAGAYAMQKQLLDRVCQAHEEDVFVANFMVHNEEQHSLCAWTEGVASSLPRTDRIVLVIPTHDDDADTLIVDWEKAQPILGHLLQKDARHIHPPRYLTLGFPDAGMRARLQAL